MNLVSFSAVAVFVDFYTCRGLSFRTTLCHSRHSVNEGWSGQYLRHLDAVETGGRAEGPPFEKIAFCSGAFLRLTSIALVHNDIGQLG